MRLLLQQLFQCLDAVLAHPDLPPHTLYGDLAPCLRCHIVRDVEAVHQPLSATVDETALGGYVQRWEIGGKNQPLERKRETSPCHRIASAGLTT